MCQDDMCGDITFVDIGKPPVVLAKLPPNVCKYQQTHATVTGNKKASIR